MVISLPPLCFFRSHGFAIEETRPGKRRTGMGENVYLSGTYAEKNVTYHVEDSDWKARHILTMINKHHLSVRSVCEVGCGAGEILRLLSLAMPDEVEFTGYEISPRRLSFAAAKNRNGCAFSAMICFPGKPNCLMCSCASMSLSMSKTIWGS